MPEVITSFLAPYLHECFNDASLTLVTSTLSTPTNWLLIRLLYAALTGSRSVGAGEINPPSSDIEHKVAFVSLLRPSSLWLEVGKKIGIDLTSLSKSGRLLYIDGLGLDLQGPNANPLQSTTFQPLSLDAIAATVRAQLPAATTPSQVSTRRLTVIIDGLDFVLASQPDADVTKAQRLISSIQTTGSAVIVTCSADSPLLHNRHNGATPLEREHSALATSLAHQSSWVYQLRGLDTGAAKDVTGVLRISKGGAHDDGLGQTTLEQGEWLYQLKGDGSTRVWLRGQ